MSEKDIFTLTADEMREDLPGLLRMAILFPMLKEELAGYIKYLITNDRADNLECILDEMHLAISWEIEQRGEEKVFPDA